jgi:hypothetical protein
MEANTEICQEPRETEIKTDLGKTETMDLEANAIEIESESEHHEVPEEEAMVETIGALEDQYGDRHLAVGHCRQSKKQT